MLNALHHRVHGALQKRNLAVERGDQLAGLVQGQVQTRCKLGFAHAVHQPQADGLGSLAFYVVHVGHHLVEVRVGVVAVGLRHLLRHGAGGFARLDGRGADEVLDAENNALEFAVMNLVATLGLILGEDELAAGTVVIKDLVAGSQESVPVDSLIDGLKSRLINSID